MAHTNPRKIEMYLVASQAINYNPITGEFFWKERANGRRMDVQAGCINQSGYRQIGHGGQIMLAHRLAWVIVHGELPDCIDHINRDRADNRICNLRSVTHAENLKNQPARRRPYRRKNKAQYVTMRNDGKFVLQVTFKTKRKAAAALGALRPFMEA